MEINPRTIMIMNARDCDSLNIRLRRSTKLVYKENVKFTLDKNPITPQSVKFVLSLYFSVLHFKVRQCEKAQRCKSLKFPLFACSMLTNLQLIPVSRVILSSVLVFSLVLFKEMCVSICIPVPF